eukprot:3097823-Amphidinium_carterae.2
MQGDMRGLWERLTSTAPAPSMVNRVSQAWLCCLQWAMCCCWRRRKASREEPPDASRESESEVDEEHASCEAGLLSWWDPRGNKVGLSTRGPCSEARMAYPTELLLDDMVGGQHGRTAVHLCWRHNSQYQSERAQQRCPKQGCPCAGQHWVQGLMLCQIHVEEHDMEVRMRSSPSDTVSANPQSVFHAQPATPPAYPREIEPRNSPRQVAQAAVERPYLSEASIDQVPTPTTSVRSFSSPPQTPRPSVSELISQFQPSEEGPGASAGPLSDYELLHRYLELRAHGSERGGRITDQDARRRLMAECSTTASSSTEVLRCLLRGVQDLEPHEQAALYDQYQQWQGEALQSVTVVRPPSASTLPTAPPPGMQLSASEVQTPSPMSSRLPTNSVQPDRRQVTFEGVGTGAPTTGYARGSGPVERGLAAASFSSRPAYTSLVMPPPGMQTAPSLTQTIESALGETSGVNQATMQALQGGRRSGAPGDGGLQSSDTPKGGLLGLSEDSLRSMGELARAQLEEKKGERGTLKGLCKEDEDITLLLRQCNRYEVQVCPEVTGKALYRALKSAAVGASGQLRQVGWCTTMRNRVAIGIASVSWGGRSHTLIEPHCLGASDFPSYTMQELDEYLVPTGDAVEQRPKQPPTWESWLRCARRQATTFSLVYGTPWKGIMVNALDQLEGLHESQPSMWPREQVYSLWEELGWRLLEEMRELRRQMLRAANRELMSKDEMCAFCLAPDCQGEIWWKAPLAYDLTHPQGWFISQVLPRVIRRHQRVLWSLTWQGQRSQQGAGGRAGGEQPSAEQPKNGRTKDGKPAANPAQPSTSDQQYPAGRPLGPHEQRQATEHAPKDDSGKSLCWNHMCWSGCSRTPEQCGKSHKPYLGGMEALHWCVQAQVVRRGGLRQGKRIPACSRDRRARGSVTESCKSGGPVEASRR